MSAWHYLFADVCWLSAHHHPIFFGALLPPVAARRPLWRAHQGGGCQSSSQIKKKLGSGNYTSNVEGINIHCFFASKMRASNNQCWIEGIIYGKLPGCYMFLLLNTGVSCRFSQRRLGQCRNWCANLLTTSTAWNLWLSPSSRVLALYMSTYNHVYVRMCIYASLCICVHVGMYTHIYIN
jgi:hypothetical protein